MSETKKFGFSLLHLMIKVEKASECVAFYTSKIGMKLLSSIEAENKTVNVLGFKGETGQHMTRLCGCLELISPSRKPANKRLVCSVTTCPTNQCSIHLISEMYIKCNFVFEMVFRALFSKLFL